MEPERLPPPESGYVQRGERFVLVYRPGSGPHCCGGVGVVTFAAGHPDRWCCEFHRERHEERLARDPKLCAGMALAARLEG